MEEIEREAYVTSAHCGTVTLAAMEMYRKEVGWCDMCAYTWGMIHRGEF